VIRQPAVGSWSAVLRRAGDTGFHTTFLELSYPKCDSLPRRADSDSRRHSQPSGRGDQNRQANGTVA
jgi:hypothetical protein